jgi:hypothetical protein
VRKLKLRCHFETIVATTRVYTVNGVPLIIYYSIRLMASLSVLANKSVKSPTIFPLVRDAYINAEREESRSPRRSIS